MKYYVLVLAMIIAFSGFGQTINDKPISEIDSDYIQIVGTSKLLSFKVTISVDYGQEISLKSGQQVVRDKNGKRMEFNSMIDALNFFSNNGYEFQQAYALTIQSSNVYHFLMRKKTQP